MNVCVLCVIPKILRTKSILFVNVRNMHNEKFILLNEKDKFIYILKNEWKNLGHFMESAWTCRQNTMYSG